MTGGPEPVNADARAELEKELAELRAERDSSPPPCGTAAATRRATGPTRPTS